MIAALPMYDFEALRAATDAFWAAIRDALRARGVEAPEGLSRGGDLHTLWRDPALLFGQTCGYPYWTSLRENVTILATPIYDFEGCDGPTHCSFLIARLDDPREALAEFRGGRAAINAHDSNTGMNLFRASVAPLAQGRPFFCEILVAGAHAASLAAVAQGRADIAAIDCVSFAHIAGADPDAVAEVRVLGRTPASPALPFIVSRSLPHAVRASVRAALREAAQAPELAEARAALGLAGIEQLPCDAYARIHDLEEGAARLGYRLLS